jgi:hypothetical protein
MQLSYDARLAGHIQRGISFPVMSSLTIAGPLGTMLQTKSNLCHGSTAQGRKGAMNRSTPAHAALSVVPFARGNLIAPRWQRLPRRHENAVRRCPLHSLAVGLAFRQAINNERMDSKKHLREGCAAQTTSTE